MILHNPRASCTTQVNHNTSEVVFKLFAFSRGRCWLLLWTNLHSQWDDCQHLRMRTIKLRKTISLQGLSFREHCRSMKLRAVNLDWHRIISDYRITSHKWGLSIWESIRIYLQRGQVRSLAVEQPLSRHQAVPKEQKTTLITVSKSKESNNPDKLINTKSA